MTVTLPFEFTGRAGEYFKIWIVNILLTFLTLGIYSAWAKVRTRRYFYGNTFLQDSSFEYLADPLKILKGRLIVFGFFVLYAIATRITVAAGVLFALFFWLIFPWVVVQALAFNARNSSYRNIRFDFNASYGRAAGVFIGGGVLAALTLGLGYPYFVYLRSKFVVGNSGYGSTPFAFSARAANFYRVYLVAFVGMVLAIGLFSVLLIARQAAGAGPEELMAGGWLAVILFYLSLGFLMVYLQTSITNLVWSNVHLGDHRLESTLRIPQMLWIHVSNTIAIVFSVGLLIPWATIRKVRYRLENLKLLAAGELDDFVAGEQETVAAAGGEIADFFDFDLGI